MPALGPRSIGAAAEMPDYLEGPAAYHAERLALGVPEGGDFGSDKIFALDAGLEELHGVAFDKGCFVGQELTARMKHRGTARKRILTVKADQALPPPGAKILGGESEIGEIIATYGLVGFGLIRLDRLAEAPSDLTADGMPVTVTKPGWLNP